MAIPGARLFPRLARCQSALQADDYRSRMGIAPAVSVDGSFLAVIRPHFANAVKWRPLSVIRAGRSGSMAIFLPRHLRIHEQPYN